MVVPLSDGKLYHHARFLSLSRHHTCSLIKSNSARFPAFLFHTSVPFHEITPKPSGKILYIKKQIYLIAKLCCPIFPFLGNINNNNKEIYFDIKIQQNIDNGRSRMHTEIYSGGQELFICTYLLMVDRFCLYYIEHFAFVIYLVHCPDIPNAIREIFRRQSSITGNKRD